MQKTTKWYDLKKVKDGYSIFFSFSIRIQAIFLLIFSILILYFQFYENKEKVNLIGFIIFSIVFILSFTFSFYVDSFLLLLTKSFILRKVGVFPFIVKKKINFSDIQSISTDILEKIDNKFSYGSKDNIPSGYLSGKSKEYNLTIDLKNGKSYKISFGKGKEEVFNNFLEELKKYL